MPNTKKSERSEGKRPRVPFGARRSKLQLSAAEQEAFRKSGYFARWFNDEHGRIHQAQAAGYHHVTQEEALSLGHGQLHGGNSDLNSKVSKAVSRKPPEKRAYLMKIDLELYREDQDAKEQVNAQVDEAIRAGQPGGNVVDNQYVPKGHTQQI